MPKVNCGVVRCSSGTYGINKWKKEPCLEHGHKNIVEWQCPNRERPYGLYCFPAEMKKGKERQIYGFKRENSNRTTKSSDTICSFHILDGIPTKANSLPTVHMGYDTKRQKTWRPLFKHPLPAKKIWVEEGEMEIGIINTEVNHIESELKLSLSVVFDDQAEAHPKMPSLCCSKEPYWSADNRDKWTDIEK